MSNDPTAGIQEILQLQTKSTTPLTLPRLSVLPAITRSAPTGTTIDESSSTSVYGGNRDSAGSSSKSLLSVMPIALAQRASSSGEHHHQLISRLPMRVAVLPEVIERDLPGLSQALDNLTPHRLNSIMDAFRLYDKERRGYLSPTTITKCIGEIIPSAHLPNSPWRLFMDWIAPHGELVEYERLVELLRKSTPPSELTTMSTMPDVLTSGIGYDIVSKLPEYPSDLQAARERDRKQIVADIQNLVTQTPNLDLDRLKIITKQKVIEVTEFMSILDLYDLSEHFKPFYDRLLSSFLTPDGKFHYAAFIGCLTMVRMPTAQPQPSVKRQASSSSESASSSPVSRSPTMNPNV